MEPFFFSLFLKLLQEKLQALSTVSHFQLRQMITVSREPWLKAPLVFKTDWHWRGRFAADEPHRLLEASPVTVMTAPKKKKKKKRAVKESGNENCRWREVWHTQGHKYYMLEGQWLKWTIDLEYIYIGATNIHRDLHLLSKSRLGEDLNSRWQSCERSLNSSDIVKKTKNPILFSARKSGKAEV